MKKTISMLLVLALMLALSATVFAATADITMKYDLSSNGSNDIVVQTGDVITVSYKLSASEECTVSVTQNEIYYDHNFFEFVADSNKTSDGFTDYTTTLQERLSGKRYVYFNTMTTHTHGTTPAEIGTFQLKVIATSGETTVANVNVIAADLKNVQYDASTQDLHVSIGTVQEQKFTATFSDGNGGVYKTMTVKAGESITLPDGPEKSGYTFTHWSIGGESTRYKAGNRYKPASDVTFTPNWTKVSTGGDSTYVPTPTKKDDSLKFNTEDHFAYVNGYPDGTVKPTGDVTRAEVAAILYRVMDADCVKTYETTRCSFSDVVRGDWFNLYVATLENAGVIVDTRTNGKFRPNEAITRAELAAMLAQFADIKSAANSFNDVSARHWASDEIAVCAKMGWINGYPDGSFRPDATITRAEMMAMINRALGRTPKSADDLLSGMKTWRDNANVNAWYYLDVQEATNSHTYTKSGSHETWKKLR